MRERRPAWRVDRLEPAIAQFIGERFYIYAAGKKWTDGSDKRIWSRDLSMAREGPPPWMLELAKLLILADLPTRVIVGSAVIEKVTPGDGNSEWQLSGVERLDRLRKPKGHPQPVWFKPF